MADIDGTEGGGDEPALRCHCQNCDWTGTTDELDDIQHCAERVSPGEPFPAGECPDCGALAQIDDLDLPDYVAHGMAATLRARGWTLKEPGHG
jgi:hypothetical protein